MEADQAESAKAVDTDGGARQILLRRRERMEMRGADGLRKQQDSGYKASYSADPALTICLAIWFGG
jgi:hypothetical protein